MPVKDQKVVRIVLNKSTVSEVEIDAVLQEATADGWVLVTAAPISHEAGSTTLLLFFRSRP